MGQTSSTSPAVNYAKLTKADLEKLITNLNERCQDCFGDSAVNMLFAIKETTENKPFLWKKSVNVKCFSMMNGQTYSKSYSLYEFLRFYRSLSQILDASEVSETLNTQLMGMSIFQEKCCSIEDQCIICMDNKPNAVLPCAHAYCDRCVRAFLGIRQKCCPLCRYKLNETIDEAWVVAEKPQKESINSYLVNDLPDHDTVYQVGRG